MVLGRNGFDKERSRDHEIWVQRDEKHRIKKRVPVSHGNAEIRTRRLFENMLEQAGKTEEHFNEVLHPKRKKKAPPPPPPFPVEGDRAPEP